jgi:1-pyrroline-4-hydroxy-2-carboxylate deaminase
MSNEANWSGVFPAVTTQFRDDFSVDVPATHKVIKALVDDGVSGLIICGTVGENCSLTREEKVELMEAACDASGGKVPVVAGVAEYTTAFATQTALAAQRAGVNGIMLMPPLVYSSQPHETAAHYRGVAMAIELPLMVYNNPLIYRTDVTPEILASLADCENVRYFKDSSGDTRRFTDLRNETGDRFVLFAGLDDVVFESLLVGAVGWVSGMSNVFPREGEALFQLVKAGRFEEARKIYDWFMPLLHLDARTDLVQTIKLCEHIAGRGTHITRPPRLPLREEVRNEVYALMERALATRPVLPTI